MKRHPLNQSGNGKGSADRTADQRTFMENFDRIFGDKKKAKDERKEANA